MSKAPKRKAKPRAASAPKGRMVYITVAGKRIKTTPRGARIHRLVRKAFKGIEVPPR